MLDDLKLIHERDAQDALGVAAQSPQQLLLEFVIENNTLTAGAFSSIVLAGMGGSALPAEIAKAWPGFSIPFEIARAYTLPPYVGNKTLVIASSYSGNTEETISALHEAAERGATIAVIAAGGKLVEIAREKQYPLVVLPTSYQPRHAVFASFKGLLTILQACGLTWSETELRETAAQLEKAVAAWAPTIPAAANPAKQLAAELAGKSPVIYASSSFFPAAYKWKIDFNENAKNVAWCNQYSEMNHNEFIGWSSHPTLKPYGVVFLESSFDHPQITKRFAITEKLLSGLMPAPHHVQAQGSNKLEQLLWLVLFGDFASLYLAVLNGINPTPVDLVEKLKAELA